VVTSLEVKPMPRDVRVPVGHVVLEGDLLVPPGAPGIVLFAHGSGSSRQSPRNRFVASALQQEGLGTLLFDLLTGVEEAIDTRTAELRFDIELLAGRLSGATRWLRGQSEGRGRRIGYFGASTGAAAALVAAAREGDGVGAVVSRGGRPDLAGDALEQVLAPTLLIVGGRDSPVIRWNEEAFERIHCEKQIVIVPGATHLFEEAGALESVARLASEWFGQHLGPEGTKPEKGS
jgi:putative phosphoribosyl transferase